MKHPFEHESLPAHRPCRWPNGTNVVEGINDEIKVIKRVAYGLRADEYFFPTSRAALPGVGR